MNTYNTFFKMLRRACLFVILALISAPAFADATNSLSTLAGRYMFFDDYKLTNWTHVGTSTLNGSRAGTNHVHSSGWVFSVCRMGRFNTGTNIPPELNNNPYAPNTNYCAYFQNSLAAKMESPVFTNGIGTIYFDIVSVNTPLTLPEIRVYVATNAVWAEVDSLTLTNGVLRRYTRTFNSAQPMAIKFVRTQVNGNGVSKEESFVAIDNIRVSEPPADVIMDKGLTPFKTYPSVNSSIDIQVRIDNAPGPNRTTSATRTNVLFVSRWNYLNQKTTAWVTNTMTIFNPGGTDGLGNGELWRTSLLSGYPDAGDLEYYFECYFNATYYQSLDYTVYPAATNALLFPPEIKSPRRYSASGMTVVSGTSTNNFIFPLRLFPSSHDTVTTMLSVNGQTPSAYAMTPIGTNKWQAKYDVVNYSGVTNLFWYFQATGAYTNTYLTTAATNYWYNTSPSRIQNGVLPYGDNCGLTDVSITNRRADWFGVKVTPGESSYVLLTLDTGKTNYLAGRGEYQNFNVGKWDIKPAEENYFTDASDKYPKTAYSQYFTSGWTPSSFSGLPTNWFGVFSFVGQTSTLRTGPEYEITQPDYWNVGGCQYVIERIAINGTGTDATGTQRCNQGLRLLGGSEGLGLGYFQGRSKQQTDVAGLGTISYKARLSRPIGTGYNNYVAYRQSEFFKTNYVINSSIRAKSADEMSPENPSVSLIAYYQSPRKFYEYRLTQVADSRAINGTGVNLDTDTGLPRDKRIRHEIWKWNNGIPLRLAYSERAVTTWPDTVYDGWLYAAPSTGTKTSFRVYNNAGSVSLAVIYNVQAIAFTAENGASIVNGAVVDSSSPIRYGAYGFHSADCVLFVPEMQIGVSNVDAGDSGLTAIDVIGGTSAPNSDEWSWPTELYTLSGSQFISTPQSTTVKVMTGTSELGPWTAFKTNEVSSYGYQTVTETPKYWNSLCAKIQANDITGVVIDAVRVESWRGENITSFPSDNWSITNGWLSYTAPDWYAHLDASQVDPTKIQGVRSPRIQGIGSFVLDYRIVAAPAEIQIQYTLNDPPSANGWVDITNLFFATAAPVPVWTNANYYLALAPATNLYVRILNVATNRQAIIDFKNIVIWDNPTNSPSDWAAYNIKITANENDKLWLDRERSGYLNNSMTSNTIPTRPMDQFDPYIMAPRLTRGLGSISFLARAYTTNYVAGDTNTSISIYATLDAWDKNRPDDAGFGWTNLITITGITNAFYRPFTYAPPIIPNDYKAIKLVVRGVVLATAGAPQRICLDEIVLTEAIYPRFDITNVKLLLPGPIVTQQPLEGEDIGIEAQLSNVLLDPTIMNVGVDYVVGTDTWGVTNASPSLRFTKPMTLVDSTNRIYRTTGDFMNTGIPEQEKYKVVQYLVWAEYEGSGIRKIYQTTNTVNGFVNPSWYYPVDFNRQGNSSTGAVKTAWSPYYITYDVPPGAVWINEINVNENSAYLTSGQRIFLNPYIEIAQPAWMDLTGWRLDMHSRSYDLRVSAGILSPGFVQPVPGVSGYGLFVIGPYDDEATKATPPYPALSTTTTVHQALSPIKDTSYYSGSTYPVGYRLRRPLGMYEHSIVHDWNPSANSPTGEQYGLTNRLSYVGREHTGGSVSYTGTVTVTAGQYIHTDSTNTWQPGLNTINWTPGRPNIGQSFPQAPTPGGSNVLITSSLVSPDGLIHGWQDNVRRSSLLFKMKKGTATNLTYIADSWFRFYGITLNNIELLSTAQQQTNTNYTVPLNNVQTNITIIADLRLAPSVIDSVTTPGMLAWLTNYVDRALAPSYDGFTTNQIPLLNQYWLDMDPTQTNRLIFRSPVVPKLVGSDLWLTLEMAKIDGSGVTNKITHLLGDARIMVWAMALGSSDPWRPFGQYWISTRSFDDSYLSHTRINSYTNAASFKWSLNENNLWFSSSELTNSIVP